jgi:hypothetical protein
MPIGLRTYPIQAAVTECRYSCTLLFWGRCIRLYADKVEIIETFTQVYAHFVVHQPQDADITCCILHGSSCCKGPELFIESLRYELPDTAHYVGYAELIVFRYLLEQLDDYVVLHAGVVTRKDKAFVVYGQSGFGKTTLTLELLRRGYGFMSDEFCPIRISDLMVEPFERLVGLQHSSPFYSFVDQESSLCLESEGKQFIDCATAFTYSNPQPCRVCSFIEITGTIDQDICPTGGVVLDICMNQGSNGVPEALRALPGVQITGPFQNGRYPAYRVTAVDRTSFVSRFNHIWKENSHNIFSVFPYKGEIDSYDRMPVLNSVPAFEALTSIFSNIVNRAPTGQLIASYGGKTAPLLMLLGRLLKNTPCYSLKPGHLAKMADLIDTIG